MKKEKRRTKSQMYPLIKTWLSSEQKKKAFCEAHQINIHTFTCWHGKYMGEQVPEPGPAFVRLERPALSHPDSPYTICYPNGVRLQINILLSPTELSKLIHFAQP